MIIYNITANIEESIHDDWLEWVQQHIPKVLATGFFIKATFTKVLVEESMGGLTYSIQYLAPSKEALESYYQQDTIYGVSFMTLAPEHELVNQITTPS